VLAEILADAERLAVPGQHDRAHLGVGGDLVQRFDQRILELDGKAHCAARDGSR